MSMQTAWAQTLLDPTQVAPDGLRAWNHSDPQKRLAVYRNNVVVSLVEALAQTFPVTQQLVGEPFFRAMAQVFVRAHPPRTRVLGHYGDDLPGFIAQFPPAAGLPYLPDVARLEMQRLQALHAADAPALDAAAIATALEDPEALPLQRWRLHPSLRLLHSLHAAVSIWAAHQDGSGIVLETVDTTAPESALVFRSGLDVMVLQASPGMAAWVRSLLDRCTLSEAIEQASGAEPAFDLTTALVTLIRHELLIGVDPVH